MTFAMDMVLAAAEKEVRSCQAFPVRSGPVDIALIPVSRPTSPFGADCPRAYVDHSLLPADGTDASSLASLKPIEDLDSSESTEFLSDVGDDDSLDELDASTQTLKSGRALILIDWDDTLFPTTWVQTNGLMSQAQTGEQTMELEKVAEVVQRTLTAAALFNGKVVIVTNADAGWVELSLSHFMPSLADVVSGIEVVSARSLHEHTGVECPFEWKRRTFRDLSESFYGPGEARNIICLGDSMHEHIALVNAVAEMSNTISKSVKFLIRPDLEQLKDQHETLAKLFEQIVLNDAYMRVDL